MNNLVEGLREWGNSQNPSKSTTDRGTFNTYICAIVDLSAMIWLQEGLVDWIYLQMQFCLFSEYECTECFCTSKVTSWVLMFVGCDVLCVCCPAMRWSSELIYWRHYIHVISPLLQVLLVAVTTPPLHEYLFCMRKINKWNLSIWKI